MLKKERFLEIITIVADYCELDSDLILSGCRSSDVVDARCILIKLLFDDKMTIPQIAKFVNRTEDGVTYLLSMFSARKEVNKWLNLDYEYIKGKIPSNCQVSTK